MKKLNKKGLGLNELPGIALTLMLTGIFFAVALIVLTNLGNNSSMGNASVAGTGNYAVQKAITAVSEIPSNWLLLIAVIVAAAVIIGIVMQSIGGQANR